MKNTVFMLGMSVGFLVGAGLSAAMMPEKKTIRRCAQRTAQDIGSALEDLAGVMFR